MGNHNGESWPYHQSKNGEMVPCKSNPCSLHGGSDVYASSPEDAYEQFYSLGDSQEGLTGESHSSSRFSLHRRVPKKRFSTMRKVATSFLMVTMTVSALSACGTQEESPSSTPQQDSTSQSQQSESPSQDTPSSEDELSEDYAKLKSRAKEKLKEYKSKAKGYGEKAKDYLNDLSDALDEAEQQSSTSGIADNGVPASLNAHPDITLNDLKSIRVVPDHGRSSAYRRDEWSNGNFDSYGAKSCWSVRDEVIKRQADPGTLKIAADGCSVEAVSFTDPYTGRKISLSGKTEIQKGIQIDHMVPISYVASNGGNAWNQGLKDSYYNDMDAGHLVAVSSSANGLKSDKGSSEYMTQTSSSAYRKAYAQDWVSIIKEYNAKGGSMSLEQSDYNALMQALS